MSRILEEEQEVILGHAVFTGVGSWVCEPGVQGRRSAGDINSGVIWHIGGN